VRWPVSFLALAAVACSGETREPSTRDGGIVRDAGGARDAGPRDGGVARDGGPPRDGGRHPNVARLFAPAGLTPTANDTYALDGPDAIYQLGRAFYADHPDDYDMLLIWTDRSVDGVFAFAVPVDGDIDGIGLTEVRAFYGWQDLTPADAGSAGRLQHVVLMNAPSIYRPGALYRPADIMLHEIGHRWSANIQLAMAADRLVLIDEFWAHWTIFANVGGPSAEGYGTVSDLGAGRFRFDIVVPLSYSRLELYQQGLLPAAEVGAMFYVDGAIDFDPPTSGTGPWTVDHVGEPVAYSGTRVDFGIDDVIATHGARRPAFGDAQTSFTVAFAVVCAAEPDCAPGVVDFVEARRAELPAEYDRATGGRGAMVTTLRGP
jgi:hypothetical protein